MKKTNAAQQMVINQITSRIDDIDRAMEYLYKAHEAAARGDYDTSYDYSDRAEDALS